MSQFKCSLQHKGLCSGA